MDSAEHARTAIEARRAARVDPQDGARKRRLGVSAYPWRTRRPRLPAGALDGLADPEERRDRPRPAPREPIVAPVPYRSSLLDRRLRSVPCGHDLLETAVRPVLHRARSPPRAPGWCHRPPDRA